MDSSSDSSTSTIKCGTQLCFESRKTSSEIFSAFNPKLFPSGGPILPQIIEVTGAHSNSLIEDFIVRAILPQELHREYIGSQVLYVNTEHHLSLLKLTQIMDAQLKKLEVDSNTRKIAIEKALGNVYSIDCFTRDDLEITLRNLDKIVFAKDDVNLLILDNLYTFFYCARYENRKLSFDTYGLKILKLLEDIMKDTGLLVLYKRPEQYKSDKSVDFDVDYRIKCDENIFVVFDYTRDKMYNVNVQLGNYIKYL